jgi:phage/plasmid-like protein (TIGR03299 family)
MSQETSQWLNQNVLIGNTEVRGTAWHYRASEQGDEPNHYPRFIPVADVERRLFGFDPVSTPVAFLKPTGRPANSFSHAADEILVDGVWYSVNVDPDHQAIVDPDNNIAFDYPTNDYQIHNYREWLLQNVAKILGADLGITSAGLLRRRAQAWVEISIPTTIETPEGVTFRPLLLAWTSLDRSLSTTYARRINETVCDNTLHARIGEEGETLRYRHSANSLGRIDEARQALAIVTKAADDFSATVKELCEIPVSNQQWGQILEYLVPTKEKETGRSLTIARNKQAKLDNLYQWDPRCAPWKGTKFGVIQTANTFNLHEATVRNTHGGGRAERNQLKIISGQVGRVDTYVSEVTDLVLASA